MKVRLEILVLDHRRGQGSPLSERQRQEREWTFFRNPNTPTRNPGAEIVVTPARIPGSSRREQIRRWSPPPSVPRITATPARSQLRTAQDDVNRPTPDISRFLPSKVATAPRNTKPSKPIPAMTARTMSSSARKVPANTQPRAIGNQEFRAIE